jgi:hypothetical protein
MKHILLIRSFLYLDSLNLYRRMIFNLDSHASCSLNILSYRIPRPVVNFSYIVNRDEKIIFHELMQTQMPINTFVALPSGVKLDGLLLFLVNPSNLDWEGEQRSHILQKQEEYANEILLSISSLNVPILIMQLNENNDDNIYDVSSTPYTGKTVLEKCFISDYACFETRFWNFTETLS